VKPERDSNAWTVYRGYQHSSQVFAMALVNVHAPSYRLRARRVKAVLAFVSPENRQLEDWWEIRSPNTLTETLQTVGFLRLKPERQFPPLWLDREQEKRVKDGQSSWHNLLSTFSERRSSRAITKLITKLITQIIEHAMGTTKRSLRQRKWKILVTSS